MTQLFMDRPVLGRYRVGVHHWRITKYDPQFRHEQGYYLRDEWTGRQIGEAFVDGVLTESEYRRVEALYASAARLLWIESGQPPLQIQGLETPDLPAQSDTLDDVGFASWRP
jgi:hypothetical protein